jgi:hypothetical protein
LRNPRELERIAHVLGDSQVRPEGVLLKNEPNLAVARGNVVDHPAVEVNLAVVRSFEPSNQAGHRGLSRPRRTDHERQLARTDFE